MTGSLHYRSVPKLIPVMVILMFVPDIAFAHTGVGIATGLSHGLLHPFSGLDHLCAMIAVGLWARQLGGRALWLVPLTFVGVMMAGGWLGMNGVPGMHNMVESGILMSLLVLGLLIATAMRPPLFASVAMVGVFALCHGYAHGAEMPHSASGMYYALGFMLSTVTLHLLGIGMATLFGNAGGQKWLRLTGVSIAVTGGTLLFAG